MERRKNLLGTPSIAFYTPTKGKYFENVSLFPFPPLQDHTARALPTVKNEKFDARGAVVAKTSVKRVYSKSRTTDRKYLPFLVDYHCCRGVR
jgi:hypothetical protein